MVFVSLPDLSFQQLERPRGRDPLASTLPSGHPFPASYVFLDDSNLHKNRVSNVYNKEGLAGADLDRGEL